MNTVRTDFLFATPSFISGAARVLDMCGTYDAYNAGLTQREADYKALFSDWRIVGQDIFGAMAQFALSLPCHKARQDKLSADERQMSLFR